MALVTGPCIPVVEVASRRLPDL